MYELEVKFNSGENYIIKVRRYYNEYDIIHNDKVISEYSFFINDLENKEYEVYFSDEYNNDDNKFHKLINLIELMYIGNANYKLINLFKSENYKNKFKKIIHNIELKLNNPLEFSEINNGYGVIYNNKIIIIPLINTYLIFFNENDCYKFKHIDDFTSEDIISIGKYIIDQYNCGDLDENQNNYNSYSNIFLKNFLNKEAHIINLNEEYEFIILKCGQNTNVYLKKETIIDEEGVYYQLHIFNNKEEFQDNINLIKLGLEKQIEEINNWCLI